MYALKVWASRSLRARSNNFPPRCKHLGRKLPPRHLRDGCTGTVELRDDTHLVRCQLGRNRAHLLVDVVLAKPLGECSKLPLDIGRLLRLQLGRPEFMVARTVTGGARWDPARRVPGKNKANGGVVFAKGMPGLKTLADKGREPVSAAREISPDIGRVLSRQRLSDRVHCAPRAFARAKIVELFVNRYTIHSGKCRVEAGLAHPLLTVAGGAIERDKRAVFGITGAYLGERGAGPGDAGRGSERRLRLARPTSAVTPSARQIAAHAPSVGPFCCSRPSTIKPRIRLIASSPAVDNQANRGHGLSSLNGPRSRAITALPSKPIPGSSPGPQERYGS